MAKDKKGFILYADLIYTVKKMTPDKAGELFLTILKYVNDEDPQVNDMVIDLVFEPIKQQLKRDLKHWESVKQKRSDAGKLGGRPKKQTEANKANASFDKQTKAKKAVIDNVNVIVNDKVIDINKRKQAFKSLINETIKTTREKYKNNKQDLIDFFEYWTEHGINDKKMRFEKESSFGISRRLDRWFVNAKKFNKNTKQKDQSDFSIPDEGWDKTK